MCTGDKGWGVGRSGSICACLLADCFELLRSKMSASISPTLFGRKGFLLLIFLFVFLAFVAFLFLIVCIFTIYLLVSFYYLDSDILWTSLIIYIFPSKSNISNIYKHTHTLDFNKTHFRITLIPCSKVVALRVKFKKIHSF